MNSQNESCQAPRKATERYKPHYTSEYSEDAWEVKIAMPGVAKDDLDISIEKEILKVSGLRKANVPENWETLTGTDHDRRYELSLDVGPEVDDTQIEAMLEYGELTIRLPLKEEAKPKTIPVT